jgi:hypothetical protein
MRLSSSCGLHRDVRNTNSLAANVVSTGFIVTLVPVVLLVTTRERMERGRVRDDGGRVREATSGHWERKGNGREGELRNI